MSVRDTIVEKLSLKFAPSHLEVTDESEKHRGHSGWREGGETHFRIRISSLQLTGLSRVAQHRAIMAELSPELASRVHALTIEVVNSAAGSA